MDLHKMHISDNVNEWFSENTLSKWLYRLPVRQGWRFLIVLICFILLGISAFEGEADALQGALQDTAEAQALMLSGAYSEEESQIYDDTGLVALEEAAQELPFTDILDAQGEGITITWEGMTEADLGDLESIKTEIQSAVDAFSSEGYSTGFILRDPNSGGGISYHADELYYSASTIKGPYVAWLVQAYPETATALYGTIENTIQWSSNDDYGALIAAYGVDGFNSWAAECGCADLALGTEWYTGIVAKDFCKLWNCVYDYFVSGKFPAEIQSLYTGTLSSSIYEVLGSEYTVYSKGGWIGEGRGTYYHVQNDAGIVLKGEHPYVLVVLSDAYGRLDLLDDLVRVLDLAHTELIE